jgi:hypothetical protein
MQQAQHKTTIQEILAAWTRDTIMNPLKRTGQLCGRAIPSWNHCIVLTWKNIAGTNITTTTTWKILRTIMVSILVFFAIYNGMAAIEMTDTQKPQR